MGTGGNASAASHGTGGNGGTGNGTSWTQMQPGSNPSAASNSANPGGTIVSPANPAFQRRNGNGSRQSVGATANSGYVGGFGRPASPWIDNRQRNGNPIGNREIGSQGMPNQGVPLGPMQANSALRP